MFPGVSLLKLFTVMAADLDLNRFAAGDVHLWPIARECFGTNKIDSGTAPEQRTGDFKRMDDAIEEKYQALMAAAPPRPDRAIDTFVQCGPPVAPGDCVMAFSRAEDHHLRTPRGFYAPVLDPWVELVSSRWPCRKIEFAGERFDAAQPRVHATEPFARSQIEGARVAQLDDLRRTARVLATAVIKWLEQEIGFAYPDFAQDLDKYLTNLWIEKEQLVPLLAAARPRLVLTVCWYYRPTFSITWAARERGIAVAEVQHGGNGPFHMGYTHWRDVPAGGYQVMPDMFFTWDAVSANNIGRWLPDDAGRILVTGRFDLDATRRAYLGDATHSPLDLAAHGSAKTILVTLQPTPSTGLTSMLLEAMRKAPSDWTWLIRSHPMAVAWRLADLQPEYLEATLHAHGIVRAESRFTTALPLAAVLPHIDHHVTGYSGTVQECAAYGIRTTFTHGSARFSFPTYIESGTADFASSADEVLNSIARSSRTQDKISDMPRDQSRALGVLEQLLG